MPRHLDRAEAVTLAGVTMLAPRVTAIRLPSGFSDAVFGLLQPTGGTGVDFTSPAGEPALVPPDSVSWRVFKNPVSLFIGGVAAVVLELAEPRVRTGVWQHTKFKAEPVQRMKRTGLAAMVTVYGARSTAEAMIAGIRRMHDRIEGVTACGKAYQASDPELLTWVQATAAFGFLEAYGRFVATVSTKDRDHFYAEGQPSADLYGALGAPRSAAEVEALFRAMHHRLESSQPVFDFLQIMRKAPLLPGPLRQVQHLFMRAALEIVPPPVRKLLGLKDSSNLRPWEAKLVRLAGIAADRVIVDASPPVQACRRLGLPDTYLYQR